MWIDWIMLNSWIIKTVLVMLMLSKIWNDFCHLDSVDPVDSVECVDYFEDLEALGNLDYIDYLDFVW